jgi:hypothetical protein
MKLSKAVITCVALASISTLLPACPDDKRADAVDAVGGAAKDQADVAKERLGKAEDKLQGNAAAAAATE